MVHRAVRIVRRLVTARSRARFPAVVLALGSLGLGLWAGLRLVGWAVPVPSASFPDAHGVLMVNGVLASLIGIERAVALGRRAFYLAPGLSSAGAILLAATGDAEVALVMVSAGAVVLLGMFVVILRRQPALHTVVPVVGAVALVAGNARAALGADIPALIPWWGSFLILVTAAERLELARVLRLTTLDRVTFAASAGVALVGCLLSVPWYVDGFALAGVGWALLGVWLLVHDIAFRNLARAGLPRFTAVSLLVGYGWLLFGGAYIFGEGGVLPGLAYDAGLHAIFLGFVLSLVFAHAPVILPAVLGRAMPFHRTVYAPLAVLHASLAVRIAADLAAWGTVREWAGLFNVAAIVLFGALLVLSFATDGPSIRRALTTDASTFYP